MILAKYFIYTNNTLDLYSYLVLLKRKIYIERPFVPNKIKYNCLRNGSFWVVQVLSWFTSDFDGSKSTLGQLQETCKWLYFLVVCIHCLTVNISGSLSLKETFWHCLLGLKQLFSVKLMCSFGRTIKVQCSCGPLKYSGHLTMGTIYCMYAFQYKIVLKIFLI